MKENNKNEMTITVAATTTTITIKKRLLKSREQDVYILMNIALLSIFMKKHLL